MLAASRLDASRTDPARTNAHSPVEGWRSIAEGWRPVNHPVTTYHLAMSSTLIDLLEQAVERFGDRPALALAGDGEDEAGTRWSYRELRKRSRLAAWRLRAAGLGAGDRILTWSPSTPELPAAYYGAMLAGLVVVPLDLRMAPDAIGRIAARADAKRLVAGRGREAPDPEDAGLGAFPTIDLADLTRDEDETLPADWEAQLDAWPRPTATDVVEVIFTSGTTGTPKGVVLSHDNIVASVGAMHRVVPPMRHRVVSLLPLSHLFEQAVALHYALDVGADVLYTQSRNPRLIFEAIAGHRTTSMVVVPQVLELFWTAVEREVERAGRTATFERTRRLARWLPYALRRLLFRRIHARLGGGFRLFVCSGAFLPPALVQAWEDLGVIVIQGYGSTETGFGTCTTREDHGLGTVGRPRRLAVRRRGRCRAGGTIGSGLGSRLPEDAGREPGVATDPGRPELQRVPPGQAVQGWRGCVGGGPALSGQDRPLGQRLLRDRRADAGGGPVDGHRRPRLRHGQDQQ